MKKIKFVITFLFDLFTLFILSIIATGSIICITKLKNLDVVSSSFLIFTFNFCIIGIALCPLFKLNYYEKFR